MDQEQTEIVVTASKYQKLEAATERAVSRAKKAGLHVGGSQYATRINGVWRRRIPVTRQNVPPFSYPDDDAADGTRWAFRLGDREHDGFDTWSEARKAFVVATDRPVRRSRRVGLGFIAALAGLLMAGLAAQAFGGSLSAVGTMTCTQAPCPL